VGVAFLDCRRASDFVEAVDGVASVDAEKGVERAARVVMVARLLVGAVHDHQTDAPPGWVGVGGLAWHRELPVVGRFVTVCAAEVYAMANYRVRRLDVAQVHQDAGGVVLFVGFANAIARIGDDLNQYLPGLHVWDNRSKASGSM